MSAFTRFVGRLFGRVRPVDPAPPATKATPPAGGREAPPPLRFRARYDAAQTGPENRNHWAAADGLSAAAANSPEVRRTLRNRARYERDNDPHTYALIRQQANDLIGSGPRLRLALGDEHQEAARLYEESFAQWAEAVNLPEKLRVMQEARPTDGESFGLFLTNAALPHPIKLDVRVIETEQVATPFIRTTDPRAVDGIEFDAAGNPTAYHVLKVHPGDNWSWGTEYDRVPARNVVHWFRPVRAGQARGVPELTPVLAVGSQTRRYAAAVLGHAEWAASMCGFLTTDLPPDADGTEQPVERYAEVEITRNMLQAMPRGYGIEQLEATQPTSSYVEFVTSKRSELGRPFLMPRNRVTGDSSQFNFASGKLDALPYQDGAWIERSRLRRIVLDRVHLAFYAEASLLGLVPDTLPPIASWRWDWEWDGFASIDPYKDATAIQLRLSIGVTTLAEECAAEGKYWRDVIDQRAAEVAYAASKGLVLAADGTLSPAAAEPDPEIAREGDDA